MSSVKREYALPPHAIVEVPVTSGTSSGDSENNAAKVYIDPRKSSVFRVNISNLTYNGSDLYIELDTFLGAPGAVPGKEITVLFSKDDDVTDLEIRFTSKFGPNASSLYPSLHIHTHVPSAIKLMSNGTDFVLLTCTHNDD